MNYRKATVKDLNQVAILFDKYRVFYRKEANIEEAKHLLVDGDADMKEMAEEELKECEAQLEPMQLDLQENKPHVPVAHCSISSKAVNCMLQNDGVCDVCKALSRKDSLLEHLDLSFNGVDSDGAEHVAALIKRYCVRLKVLCLDENEISCKGINSIAESFSAGQVGNIIEELQFNSISIKAKGAEALITGYGKDGRNMPNLKHISLDRNYFSANVIHQLHSVVQETLAEMDDNLSEDEPDGKT